MERRRGIPGSTRVPRVGMGVPPNTVRLSAKRLKSAQSALVPNLLIGNAIACETLFREDGPRRCLTPYRESGDSQTTAFPIRRLGTSALCALNEQYWASRPCELPAAWRSGQARRCFAVSVSHLSIASIELLFARHAQSPLRRDAATNTRDACAPRGLRRRFILAFEF